MMNVKEVKRLFVTQYIIIGLLIFISIYLVTTSINKNTSEVKNNNNQSTKNETDYDISMMNQVTVSDILSMFEDGKTHVLYIGRSTCRVCKIILPNLQTAQEELNYVTQYLDISSADRNSDEWKELEKLLDIETTMNVTNDDGEKEFVKETFGYFIGNYGYTPSLIIIDENKMIAGHIGNYELEELKTWLKANGIK